MIKTLTPTPNKSTGKIAGTDSLCPGAKVFSTCPSSAAIKDSRTYRKSAIRVAQWSEDAGCDGILVNTDNSMLDSWVVAQTILEHTFYLSPMVAVQPVYMHPYNAAKMVASLSALFGRAIHLNLVANGNRNDLSALNDLTPHDARCERLAEYTRITLELLRAPYPVTYDGRFYQVRSLVLSPPLALELMPEVLISGLSTAGLAIAQTVGATPVQHPGPPMQRTGLKTGIPGSCGLRIGIIARADEDEAWREACERFSEDRPRVNGSRDTYWLRPFETHKANCPYLVGSYDVVAAALRSYLSAGYDTFILDTPPAEEEFEHTRSTFQAASHKIAA